MKAKGWMHMSWWQKTRVTALLGACAAILLALATTAFIPQNDTLSGSTGLFTLTAMPLAIVVLIASFARAQNRVNARSGSGKQRPAMAPSTDRVDSPNRLNS